MCKKAVRRKGLAADKARGAGPGQACPPGALLADGAPFAVMRQTPA